MRKATSSMRPNANSQPLRSRSGCWACRDRSVKCDEARPRCRGCEKLGLSCQYGIRLQWVEDSIARGICHGRQRQHSWLSNPSKKRGLQSSSTSSRRRTGTSRSKTPTFFMNTFSGDVLHYVQVTHPRSQDCHAPHYIDVDILSEKSKFHEEDEFQSPCVARPKDSELGRHSLASSDKFGDIMQDYRSRSSQQLNPASTIQFLDESDGYILQFYERVVCSKMSLLDNENHNPHRFLVMPMVFSSTNILSAVLTVGATKLSFIDTRFHQKALFHRQQTLINLADTLQHIGSGLANYLEALTSTLLLCWSDISDSCRSSWTKHLMGLAGILNACPEQADHDPHASKLIRACRQYLVYHIIMTKATFCDNSILPNSKSTLSNFLSYGELTSDCDGKYSQEMLFPEQGSWNTPEKPRLLSIGALEDLDHIDTHQGFSNSLLLLVNDICDLVEYRDTRDPNHTAHVTQRVYQLENSLQNLVQLQPEGMYGQIGSQNMTQDEKSSSTQSPQRRLQSIMATAEANRLAAFLFLHETCALHFPEITPKFQASRSDYIQKILSLVEAICNEHVTAALPIWPVFMAGFCTGEENRVRILNILDKFQGQRLFGSIPPACAAIEHLWKQRDLSADENPRNHLPTLSSLALSQTMGPKRSRNKQLKYLQTRAKNSGVVEMQYPWEQAISMLKGSILILT